MTRGAIIRLRPTGPWRIGPNSGKRDETDRVFHSDTLFSAVCDAMRRLGWLEAWLDATVRSAGIPALRFSSAFPFLRDTLYVPPPRTHWPPALGGKVRWKGARFVPVSLVQALLAEQTLDEDRWAIDGGSECVIPADRAQGGGPFRVSLRSGAAVDALGAAALPHATACLEFAPDAGLWFAAIFRDEQDEQAWSAKLASAWRLLADCGLGGERSQGWGRFAEPEIRTGEFPRVLIEVPVPAEGAAAHWLLSLYQPAAGDSVDWTKGDYAVTARGGRVESPVRWGDPKKVTHMVEEGSVLHADAMLTGTALDVAPEGCGHAVYRAGFCVAVPIPLRAGF
jgi:CRISPR-associated protein Csm4